MVMVIIFLIITTTAPVITQSSHWTRHYSKYFLYFSPFILTVSQMR